MTAFQNDARSMVGSNVKAFVRNSGLSEIADSARKRFDDAIYRLRTGDTKTAEDLWAELKIAQSSTDATSAYVCMGLLNNLKRRGQISDW